MWSLWRNGRKEKSSSGSWSGPKSGQSVTVPADSDSSEDVPPVSNLHCLSHSHSLLQPPPLLTHKSPLPLHPPPSHKSTSLSASKLQQPAHRSTPHLAISRPLSPETIQEERFLEEAEDEEEGTNENESDEPESNAFCFSPTVVVEEDPDPLPNQVLQSFIYTETEHQHRSRTPVSGTASVLKVDAKPPQRTAKRLSKILEKAKRADTFKHPTGKREAGRERRQDSLTAGEVAEGYVEPKETQPTPVRVQDQAVQTVQEHGIQASLDSLLQSSESAVSSFEISQCLLPPRAPIRLPIASKSVVSEDHSIRQPDQEPSRIAQKASVSTATELISREVVGAPGPMESRLGHDDADVSRNVRFQTSTEEFAYSVESQSFYSTSSDSSEYDEEDAGLTEKEAQDLLLLAASLKRKGKGVVAGSLERNKLRRFLKEPLPRKSVTAAVEERRPVTWRFEAVQQFPALPLRKAGPQSRVCVNVADYWVAKRARQLVGGEGDLGAAETIRILLPTEDGGRGEWVLVQGRGCDKNTAVDLGVEEEPPAPLHLVSKELELPKSETVGSLRLQDVSTGSVAALPLPAPSPVRTQPSPNAGTALVQLRPIKDALPALRPIASAYAAGELNNQFSPSPISKPQPHP